MREGTSVWLVRHAESNWNALGLVQGQADQSTLTDHGRAQALQVAERFRDQGVVAVYASDLRRTRETAAPVAALLGLSVHTDPALRERCFGVFEGGPVSALCPEVTGISGHRVVDVHARPVGGESLDDVQQRVAPFVDWLEDEHYAGDVVVVAHGGSVRAVRNYCAGLAVEDMVWDAVANGSVWPVQLPRRSPGVVRQDMPTEFGGVP
jgi:probable phosphoglycerate mutase